MNAEKEAPKKKSKVLGWVCTVWGGLVVLNGLPTIFRADGSAYSVGASFALLFGAVMLYAGVRELRKPDAASSDARSLAQIDDVEELQALLGQRQDAKDWVGMIAIISRISALEPSVLVQAKYSHTIGVIYRDELHDVDAARRSFELALTLDPTLPNPRRALDALQSKGVQ